MHLDFTDKIKKKILKRVQHDGDSVLFFPCHPGLDPGSTLLPEAI